MALVALFLGAGELVTTPVPKDKQVGGHAHVFLLRFSAGSENKIADSG
jgi:hypothetical protein